MLSLLLLILTVSISAIIIRVGAIALEITGLPEEQSHFQALSSFTGVGYTTREAEFVLNHPQRRKVIRYLIWIGSAGVITSIATLAGTLVSSRNIVAAVVSNNNLGSLPINPTQLILILIIMVFLLANFALKNKAIARLLKEVISVWLMKEKIVEQVNFEEFAITSLGYGVVRVVIDAKCPLTGKRLVDAHLDNHEIKVLSVDRAGDSLPFPTPDVRLAENDSLLCFGPVVAIREHFGLNSSIVVDEETDAEISSDDLLPIGALAPDFSLLDQGGKEFSLSDQLKKGSVVLFFYPKDKSYICSQMVRDYSTNAERMSEHGVTIAGINPASVDAHSDFCGAVGSKIFILSDPDKNVSKDYHALALGGLLVDRSVYVIAPNGKICYAERGNPSLNEVLGAAEKTCKRLSEAEPPAGQI